MTELRGNILIVEDERIAALALTNMLARMGLKVCASVASGEEAVERLAEIDPQLVFMDINLEGEMDGIEAARLIHELRDVPICYVTAYSDEATRHRATATAPVDFLAKPLMEGDVARIVGELTL